MTAQTERSAPFLVGTGQSRVTKRGAAARGIRGRARRRLREPPDGHPSGATRTERGRGTGKLRRFADRPGGAKAGGPVTVWCAPPRENNRENPLHKKRGRSPECRILQVVQRIIHFYRWIFGKMFAVLYGHLQKGWYNNSKHFIRRAAERNLTYGEKKS